MNLIRKSRCASIFSYMICLILILVSSLAFQGCQKDEFVTDDNVISPRLTQIITTFELKKTSIIPENIKAIEFPNEGKLEAFLKNMKKDKKCVIKGRSKKDGKIKIKKTDSSLSINRLKSGSTEGTTIEGDPDGWWFQDLGINLYWGDTGDNEAINITSSMIGLTLGAGYTQLGFSASWNPDTGRIEFHIDGQEEYYLFVEGIGVLATNEVDVDGSYDPSTGYCSLNITN